MFIYEKIEYKTGDGVRFATKTLRELLDSGWVETEGKYRLRGEFFYMNEEKLVNELAIGVVVEVDGRFAVKLGEQHYSPGMMAVLLPPEYVVVEANLPQTNVGRDYGIINIKTMSNGNLWFRGSVSEYSYQLTAENTTKLLNALLEHRGLPKLGEL